jgi:predicted unusual protein kinase regulating ubiquinone biosynthesis (AarF/ABC1/UbiB family)
MIDRFRNYSRVFHATSRYRFHSSPAPTRRHGSSVEERAAELRRCLQESGPAYSGLARYLSSRIDLLPAEYCRELELTPDVAPALSPSEVERIMTSELGASYRRLFKEFALVPLRSNLIGQTHRAELVNGESVAVFVMRPEYSDADRANRVAEWLDHGRIRDLCPDCSKHDVIADFLEALRRSTDLRFKSQVLTSTAPGAESADATWSRKFYVELSGERVLTLSYREEMYLEQLLCADGYDLQGLARTICQKWLWDSLNGRFCPLDPRAGNMTTVEPRAIRFDGNEFVELPRRTKDNLRLYLMATLEDDPDHAARYLLEEMIPPKRGVNNAGEFRSRFRQAAYFGALEPILGTNTNALAQLIFQHWKTALDFGYEPTPYLLCFYRGLFSIARVARKLAPTEDPLREGLEELDAIMTVGQFKDLAAVSYWFQNSDKFAMASINFPRAMDEALKQASRPNLDDWSEPTSERSSQKRRSPLARIAFVAAVTTFILQGDVNTWIEKSVVIVLLIVGLLALRMGED